MANTAYLSPIYLGKVLLLPNGAPNYNGLVYTALAGTGTFSNTFTSNTGSANNGNPLVINPKGRLPNQIFISAGQNTKIWMTDNTGTIIYDTQDNILGVNDPTYVVGLTVANAAYTEANAAYSAAVNANTLAITAASVTNAAFALANAAANTVSVSNNGILVLAKANINFNNSATVNVMTQNVVTILNQADIGFLANLPAIGVATGSASPNGWCNVASNCTFMWGFVDLTTTAAPNPVQVTFPVPFQTRCFGVQVCLTSNGSGQDDMVRPFSVSRAGFTATYDFFGGTFSPCTVYWFAVGN